MAEDSQARPDRPMAAPVVHFRIDEQVERLKKEPSWRSGNRNAITLTKGPALRVVLTVLRRGTRLEEHHARGPLTFQVLSGSVRVQAAGQTLEVGPGEVLALESALEHQVEALEESAFLLTLNVGGK